MTTIDDTKQIGIRYFPETHYNHGYMALTTVSSKWFKTYNGAKRYMQRMGITKLDFDCNE